MAAVTIYSDFGARKSKVCHCFNCFSIYLPWSDGTGLPWSLFSDCWALSQLFNSLLSLSSRGSLALHFCHKGGVTCISEVIDISLEIFIPACASSSPTFLMMYSAYKLNKHSDNIQPWRIPFPILNQSSILAWRIPGTGAWWAAVYGVAQSRTRLMWLSSSSSSRVCTWVIGLGLFFSSVDV